MSKTETTDLSTVISTDLTAFDEGDTVAFRYQSIAKRGQTKLLSGNVVDTLDKSNFNPEYRQPSGVVIETSSHSPRIRTILQSGEVWKGNANHQFGGTLGDRADITDSGIDQ